MSSPFSNFSAGRLEVVTWTGCDPEADADPEAGSAISRRVLFGSEMKSGEEIYFDPKYTWNRIRRGVSVARKSRGIAVNAKATSRNVPRVDRKR